MSESERKRYKSVRLPYYHYTESGAYFLTLVSANRACIFGRIEDGQIVANEIGLIVIEEWLKSGVMRPYLVLDAFALLPNHFHGIVVVNDEPRAHSSAALPPLALPRRVGERAPASISSFLAGFKAATTTRINILRGTPREPVWQPKFYDHVIRGDRDLANIRDYILNNAREWGLDRDNPEFKSENHESQ